MGLALRFFPPLDHQLIAQVQAAEGTGADRHGALLPSPGDASIWRGRWTDLRASTVARPSSICLYHSAGERGDLPVLVTSSQASESPLPETTIPGHERLERPRDQSRHIDPLTLSQHVVHLSRQAFSPSWIGLALRRRHLGVDAEKRSTVGRLDLVQCSFGGCHVES